MRPGITQAARALYASGVIAYPTEGVFGLGCLPQDIGAIQRILDIKQRDAAKGLILIASSPQQLRHWIAPDEKPFPAADPQHPTTWIATPGPYSHALIQGIHPGLAVRLTTNPVAAAICKAVDSPIISTSANVSGRPVVRNLVILRRQFGRLVDYVVPGRCGPASGPSAIRLLSSGKVLRPSNE